MKVIITKYAASSGVVIIEAQSFPDTPRMIKDASGKIFAPYYHNNEWHQTKESAVKDIRHRFAKKRESLSRQLAGLADKMNGALEAVEKAEL